jgi:N-acetylmuramoyl-L-alanine amidase
MPVKHQIQQGECIASLAEQYGFFPETLWNHADNSDLRKKRNDSYALLPGDMVTIPDKQEKHIDGAPEKRHRFRRKGVPEKLRVRFCLEDQPRGNTKYRLEVDGHLTEGVTDAEGWLQCTIPLNARVARVYLGDAREPIDLELGHLDPIDSVSGVQGRLLNLGFWTGPIDGQFGAELEAALVDFQAFKELEISGQIDDATKNALKQAYGG